MNHKIAAAKNNFLFDFQLLTNHFVSCWCLSSSPAGSFCASASLLNLTGSCSRGYFCPQGVSSSTHTVCPQGTYCPVGSSTPTLCSAGSYCPYPGLSSAVGVCRAGWYCPEGSTSITQVFKLIHVNIFFEVILTPDIGEFHFLSISLVCLPVHRFAVQFERTAWQAADFPPHARRAFTAPRQVFRLYRVTAPRAFTAPRAPPRHKKKAARLGRTVRKPALCQPFGKKKKSVSIVPRTIFRKPMPVHSSDLHLICFFLLYSPVNYYCDDYNMNLPVLCPAGQYCGSTGLSAPSGPWYKIFLDTLC